MFDLLRNRDEYKPLRPHSLNSSPQNDPQTISSYIIHMAAVPPDVSRQPLWNDNPDLDSLTWETLTTELRNVRPEKYAAYGKQRG